MASEQPARDRQRVRFGIFEADLDSGELRRDGVKVRLQGKPFEVLQVLQVLLENPGELVTRENLQERLWPDGTHVDFDHNLNNAVNRLGEVLRDSADSPRFIQTLPRRGYRFVAPVAPAGGGPVAGRWMVAAAAVPAAALLAWILLPGLLGDGARSPAAPDDPVGSGPIRLAVLPFRNLSGDPTQSYVSDGLTEELIVRLGQLQPERLRVLARPSRAADGGERFPAAGTGRELDADYLLEGTFRLSQDRIRVTARLVTVRDSSQLWSEVYDRPRRDVLILQSDVAQQVAAALQLELLPDVRGRLAAAAAVNPKAQDAYWKGRFRWRTVGLTGFESAFVAFHEAIQEDPDYAPGYLGLADAYAKLAYWRLVRPRPALERSLEAAGRALERDPGLTLAAAQRARVRHYLDWDWEETGRQLAEAVAAEPASYVLHEWYAEHLAMRGEWEAGLREMRRAGELRPVSAALPTGIGWHLLLAGRFDEAEQQLEKAVELHPELPLAHYDLGLVHLARGRPADAVEPLETSFRLAVKTHSWAALAVAHYQGGDRDYGLRLAQQLQTFAELRYVSPIDLAFLEIGFGRAERALDYLEQAWQDRDPWLGYLKVAPVYRPLKDSPRYRQLLARIGL